MAVHLAKSIFDFLSCPVYRYYEVKYELVCKVNEEEI